LAALEPLVAKPHSPDNRDTAYNCRDVKLDQAYIGSCTGGKITDMIFAANILKGNRVKIPTFVVPGSTEVHADMKRLNLRGVEKGPHEKSIEDVLLDAGCESRLQRLLRLPGRAVRHIRPAAEERSLHQHDQPQFPRPHGKHQERGLSGQPADGGRQRADGICHRSARICLSPNSRSRRSMILPASTADGGFGFGEQGAVGFVGTVGVGDLDVVGLVAGHHLIAGDAVGDGVHDRPLRRGGVASGAAVSSFGQLDDWRGRGPSSARRRRCKCGSRRSRRAC
jgi:hypothetical protein